MALQQFWSAVPYTCLFLTSISHAQSFFSISYKFPATFLLGNNYRYIIAKRQAKTAKKIAQPFL